MNSCNTAKIPKIVSDYPISESFLGTMSPVFETLLPPAVQAEKVSKIFDTNISMLHSTNLLESPHFKYYESLCIIILLTCCTK